MQTYDFKSTVVSNEININEIAKHFGINKKFKWEEPLILDEKNLEGIILQPKKKFAFIFHFGSIAFINLTFHEMQDIVNYLKNSDKSLDMNIPFKYVEDFKLEIKQDLKPEDKEDIIFEINYNSITANKLYNYILDIIATLLAKSVALEKIENDIDEILDEIENIIEFLDKGKLNLGDEQLAKMSGKILRFRYNTISSLMLLDKPDIAWKKEDAEDFFLQLSTLFEMKDRYEITKKKTDVLLDIIEVFTGLTHAKRGTKLEWMVIILIAIELIVYVAGALVSMLGKVH
jgi:required for meiotic nuclear division protein 1